MVRYFFWRKNSVQGLFFVSTSLAKFINKNKQCNSIIYKEWLSRSIAKIKHSTDNSNNFISPVSFQNKYEIQMKLLMFFGIIFAIRLLQQQIQTTQLFNTFLKSQKSSRIVYYQLISDKGQWPIPCQEKWHKDIGSTTNRNVDWRKVYQTSAVCTRNSKTNIYINFRFLHRWLATNSYLQKIGIRQDRKCNFCHNEREDLFHIFWQCQKNKNVLVESCNMASVLSDSPKRQPTTHGNSFKS